MQNPVPNCNFVYLDMYSIAYIEGNVKDTKNKTKFDHQNFYLKKKNQIRMKNSLQPTQGKKLK